MDHDEIDPFALLMSFDDPADRARFALNSGLIDRMDPSDRRLWSGGGVDAAINNAILGPVANKPSSRRGEQEPEAE